MKRAACLLAAVLAASCASDNDAGNTAAASGGPKPLSQRLNESNGYDVDADGNWVPRNNKRSSFESQGASPYFKGSNREQNKQFKTGEYGKRSWWGTKEYGRQSYQGNTDGSRFRQASRLDGTDARENGAAATETGAYQTGTYGTGDAREASTGRLEKPSDAETDIRRRVYQPPEIIDWREQRTLSLEQSRGILGR